MTTFNRHTIRATLTITVFVALFILQGCFLVSDDAHNQMLSSQGKTETVGGSEQEKSAQVMAEDNVEAYVKEKFGKEHTYKIYNFGQVFRIKKAEHKQLEELLELRKLAPGMKDHYGAKIDSVITQYDTLIAQKTREIKTKNIRYDYLISHIFTIREKAGNGTVYEGDFILDDALKVKDFRMDMAAELAKDDFDWFYYFFQKFPVFNSGDYDNDVELSNNLYDYYNARLAKLETGKEEFLLTALRVTRIVNKTKKYDPDIISGFVLMKKLEEQKVCSLYKPVTSTPAQEIKVKTYAGDSLVGYKIFHKFECTGSDGKTETKAVYAELDPYFVPAGILDVAPPFEQYFEKK